MTIKNIIRLSHISFIIISIFYSCASSKINVVEELRVDGFIDDYINGFQELHSLQSLEAIDMYVNFSAECFNITIRDTPEIDILTDISYGLADSMHIFVGSYRKISVKIVVKNNTNVQVCNPLINDSLLINKVAKITNNVNNGLDDVIGLWYQEYNPCLQVVYNIDEKIKIVELDSGYILRSNFNKRLKATIR